MADKYKLDCKSEVVDCQSIIQSGNETEAIEQAKNQMREDYGQDHSDEEIREEHLQVV